MELIIGTEAGDICNRKGCKGIIEEREKGDCSCHINPPCSACTEPRAYCLICDWDEAEELAYVSKEKYKLIDYGFRALDKTKIDYRISSTSCTQTYEGVYPEGTTRDQILKELGTGGDCERNGRWGYFADGRFKYIAYTD